MLVLSRKPGEKIVVGGNVIITVFSSSNKNVKLGFEAPEDVSIHRKEIHDAIQRGEDPIKK